MKHNSFFGLKSEIKRHSRLLKTIDEFKKEKKVKLLSNNLNLNQRDAKLKSNGSSFLIDFEIDVFSQKGNLNVGRKFTNVQFGFNDAFIKIDSVFLMSRHSYGFTGLIHGFNTNKFSAKSHYYYQLVIPLAKELTFHWQVEDKWFRNDLGLESRTGTNVDFGDETMDISVIRNEAKLYFLIIESSKKQDLELFSSKAHSIRTVMGYLTGHYAGNEGFFFASTNKKESFKHFRYSPLRESMVSAYTPINSNPYSYLRHDRSRAKKYESTLRPVSFEEFSLLCKKALKSIEFSTTLILILESSIASLMFMPGGYAMALEALATLIIGNQKQNTSPIKEKGKGRRIRDELLNVIEQYSSEISPEGLDILTTRINQINNRTNSLRLKASFDKLGIELNELDLKTIQARDDLLHGRFPDLMNNKNDRSTQEINRELYFTSLRFYTLINMLILKWVGYDNRVVNYTKLKQAYTDIELNEEPFRQV